MNISSNWETIKDQVECCAVPINRNEELIEALPHVKMGDIAMIPRLSNTQLSFGEIHQLENEFMQIAADHPDELMRAAVENTKQQIFVCLSPVQYVKKLNEVFGLPIQTIMQPAIEATELYVICSEELSNGGVALFFPHILQQALEKIQSENDDVSYIDILPSSRHELLVYPGGRIDHLEAKDLHDDVQNEVVSQEDRLTNQVYRFDGRLYQLCEEFEFDKEEKDSELEL